MDRRWLWVILAGLLVLAFQFWEDQPFLRGFDRRFWFEGFVYGAVFTAWAGLALSFLSASRREWASRAGCHHVQHRLQTRLNGAQSHDELAEVLLQFFRFVALESAALLVYDPALAALVPFEFGPPGRSRRPPLQRFQIGYFFPFILNGPGWCGSFSFPPGIQPSPQQARLLGDLAPTIASAFQRIQLEELVKRCSKSLTPSSSASLARARHPWAQPALTP